MRKFRLLSLFLIVTLIVPFSSVAASTTPASQAKAPTTDPTQTPAAQPVAAAPTPPGAIPAHAVEIDPAALAELSAEEIIAQYGYVPHALADQVKGQSMMMVIELDQAPLATYYAEQKAAARTLSKNSMTVYVNQIKATQAKVQSQLEAMGVQIISKPYTTVYNGFLAHVPLEQTNAILALDNVKAVHRAPQHTPDLNASVPLIGAPEVWEDLGFDGEGVTIAVIDTGIDYTHAALGGSGNPDDYANNNPDVVEAGTFPTVKVIDGHDYAGTDYNADPDDPAYQPEPHPDDDPLDEYGHGTHVSSIAAGIAAGQVMTGVAPGATLMALKVFGAEGSTNLVMNALDDAVAHYIEYGWPQVINMSLGSDYGPGDVDDPDVVATNAAVTAGIVVATSIGNSADVPYIAGSPGTASGTIGTAASTTGYATMPTIQDAGGTIFFTPIMYQPSAFDETAAHYNTALTAPLAYVGHYAVDNLLCATADLTQTGALTGKIALIQRGTCGFAVKARNAEALGAAGVIIYNSAAGGDALITMADDGLPNGIPAGFVGLTDGLSLARRDGQPVTVSAENDVTTLPNPYIPADTVADFSSRGPRGTDSKLKPDVTAPGVAIFAAAMGTGTQGVSFNGTSMASPHIAGVAALMVQAHPDWTPEQIKAAIMNTAVDLVDGSPIPRQGAGRVRAYEAVHTPVVAVGEETAVSLSELFLAGENEHVITRTVTLYNSDAISHTYAVGWAYQGASFDQGVDVAFSATNVTVGPHGEAEVLVTFTFDATQLPANYYELEEIYGYITLMPADPNLTISKTVETVHTPVLLGDVVTYTISLSNLGSNNATGFVLTDILPAGLIGDNLDEMVDIPAGETVSFVLTATVSTDPLYYGATITNIARFSHVSASGQAEASITLEPGTVDLVINKTVVTPHAPVLLGDVVTYTISVANNGTLTAEDVAVTDTLPAGLIGDNLDEMVDIPAGQTVSFVLTATVSTDPLYYGATITNIARFSHVSASGQAEASITLEPGTVDLVINKTVVTPHTPVLLGDVVTYTISVANNGTLTAEDVAVTDTLPAGLIGDNLDEMVDIPAGETVSFVLTATVSTDPLYYGATITNIARFSHVSASGQAEASITVQNWYYVYLPLVMHSTTATTAVAVQPQAAAQPEGMLRVPFYFVPRPYTELDITAQTVIDDPATDAATFEITHTGPISSSLWVFPLLVSDPQETGTAGDVRAFGADYGWNSGTYGPMISFAIDAWAPWHTAMYYFTEFDLYIDNNEDGNPEYLIYNYPVGDGTYIPRIYALQTGLVSRYSPYLIYTDYNSGYMEFYVPAAYLGLGSSNTTFDYQLFGYDWDANEDEVAPGSFDYARSPFAASYTGPENPDGSFGPGPADHAATIEVMVNDLVGYAYSQPEGAMIVDYVGNPQNGGQAYLYPITLPDIDAVTILHTNDFHGQLEPSGSNPGIARVASVINNARATRGTDSVLLVDGGDEMQGSLLSNIFKGESTIDLFNFMGYNAATFGNHEFDWGQQVLISRTLQADYPFLATNLVVSDTGSCATAGWTVPAFAQPWVTMTVGAPGHEVVIGLIGVTSQETPYITIAEATQGLCFKDAATSIAHYYDAVKAAGAEVLVVISHLGNVDGGYGYGFPVYGDQTLAKRLVEAGNPVNLIIGGHSHTNLSAAQVVSGTTVVQAYYNGRRVGRADVIYNRTTEQATIAWRSIVVNPPPTPPATQPAATLQDAATTARLNLWAQDPDYLALINTVIGYTNISLTRSDSEDNTMGAFVNDAIYNELNNDAEAGNNADMVFNNSGGLRADILATGAPTTPYTLTYGALFNVLPFGNQTIVGDMTGAQIMELLNQSATLFKGTLQVAGIRFKYYSYGTLNDPTKPKSYNSSWWAWGAYDVEVKNGNTWEPIDMDTVYRVGTNEFLAPAGQDGFTPFKYMTNISYWGDMLNQVLSWTSATYGTPATAYNGPLGDGTLLDGRIIREGDNVSGPIIPVTILHHNDSHGRLSPTSTAPGYTNLVTLIRQEWKNNPTRTILLNAGDTIQGDAMAAFFKAAFTGKGADGTELPADLQINPILRAMNALTYTAMTLGNHEYNFGGYIFTGTLGQANFPLLQANVYDDGRYGLAEVDVKPYVTVTVGAENISLAILGIGNHRIPQYELPSNIPGLTFTNPITETQNRAPALQAAYDGVVALTHIGFTEDPKSVEVDENVDTNLAAQTTGVDVIIGGHSHTDPSKGYGNYKYLPTFVGSADNMPVLINQAYRYNSYLGEVVLGMRPDGMGGYEVAARAGKYIAVTTAITPDPVVKAIVQPYEDFLTVYKSTILGTTIVPLDALNAFTEETNAANLQADASKWKLESELPAVDIDFHLSGAMTNGKVAGTATLSTPYTLTVGDMFTLMPYENSLLVMNINGEQLKAILERGYRNYWYYKYVPNHGGYSYYTTCMLDVSAGTVITYTDDPVTYTVGVDHIAGMSVNGVPIDFTAATTYTVSTVNYLAAGSCNFNDGGVTLWPLDQTIADTQYYVRDVVIEYIPTLTQPINPQVEGRLQFVAP